MDNQVSIREEKITISPEERELILSFFKRLKSETNGMPPVKISKMVNILNKHTDDEEVKYLLSYGKLQFYSDQNVKVRAKYNENNSTIYINVPWFNERIYNVDLDKIRPITSEFITKLNYSKLIAGFAHEFVHYKQHRIAYSHVPKGKYTLSSKKPYMLQPFEQQAWAVEYLELLRQNLPKISAEEILTRLKRLGVVDHRDLRDLKNTDYKAWKSIMKNIIVTALQDLNQQSKKL